MSSFYARYLPPLFPYGQGAFLALCLVIIGVAMLVTPNRRKVMLATMFLMAAWQGGAWIGYIQMDVRIFHLMLFALLFWNLSESRFSFRKWKPYIRPAIPWLLLSLWLVVGTSVAVNPGNARQGSARFFTEILFFVTLLSSVRTGKDFRFLIICIAIAIMGQSVLAMLQFKITGITFGVIDDSRTHMWWRARGTFRHPNNLGMTLVVLVPIMIRGVISALSTKDARLLKICSAAAIMGGIAILTTYNRGSWVGLGTGLFFMVSLDLLGKGGKTKRYARMMIAGGLVVMLFGVVKFGDFIVNRLFMDDQEEILQGRESLSEEGMQVFRQHPVLGVGYGNEQFYSNVTFVHNVYILVASETGVPGLLLFLWFIYEFLRLVVAGLRSRVEYVKNYSRGLVASIIGFLVAGIPGPDFWISYGTQIYFWAAIAVIASLRRLEHVALQQMRRRVAAPNSSKTNVVVPRPATQ